MRRFLSAALMAGISLAAAPLTGHAAANSPSPTATVPPVVIVQPGPLTTVRLLDAAGAQIAAAQYVPPGSGVPKIVTLPPPTIANGHVYYTDAVGQIWALGPDAPAPRLVATLPGVGVTSLVSIAVSAGGGTMLAQVDTVTADGAADERLYDVAATGVPTLLRQTLQAAYFDTGVPLLIGDDVEGPVVVTDAYRTALEPQHGHAAHLDPLAWAHTGSAGPPVGGADCILLSETVAGTALCATETGARLSVQRRDGSVAWTAPAPDAPLSKALELAPDGGAILADDHLLDNQGHIRSLPAGFSGTAWLSNGVVGGTLTSTTEPVAASVDLEHPETASPLQVPGAPAGRLDRDLYAGAPPFPAAASAPAAAPAPLAQLPVTQLLLLLVVVGGGGFVLWRRRQLMEAVSAYQARLSSTAKQAWEEATTIKEKEPEKPAKPQWQPVVWQRQPVVGPDFSLLLDGNARRLVEQSPQAFCDYVRGWLDLTEDGRRIIAEATVDIDPYSAWEDRLHRGAERLARMPQFTPHLRNLAVWWLSSTNEGRRAVATDGAVAR